MKNENNLILDFMGIKPEKDSSGEYTYSDSPWIVVRDKDREKVLDAMAEYSKYHVSWDWLMPVIKKCTDTGYPFKDLYSCWEKLFGELESSFLGNHIEEAYSAVIEFIKYYNEYD